MSYFTIGLLLAFKHFVADGPLQTAYQYRNKGTFGHPGGILHAGIHGALTLACLLAFVSGWLALGLALLDFAVHYAVDLLKTRITASRGWSDMGRDDMGRECLRIRSDWYFYALVADQALHFATYVAILALAVQA